MDQMPGVSESAVSAPQPQVSVPVSPPPGKKGPVGMAPRQSVTRVNTGSPASSDIGSEQIRTINPPTALPIKAASRRGSSMTTMSSRLSADALIQEAMLASIEDSVREKTAGIKKTAAAAESSGDDFPSVKVAMALADACLYMAGTLRKEASLYKDPEVSATANKPVNNDLGYSVKSPMPKGGIAGSLPTSTTISGGPPTTAMVDQKHGKTAQRIKAALSQKHAEGSPQVMDASDSAPSKPQGATHLIASNRAAIDATRREAAAPDKTDAGAYLKNPMQSASQDPVLKNQVQHTDSAGAKVAFDIFPGVTKTAAEIAKTSATDETIKMGAARALLATLTAQVRAAQGGES